MASTGFAISTGRYVFPSNDIVKSCHFMKEYSWDFPLAQKYTLLLTADIYFVVIWIPYKNGICFLNLVTNICDELMHVVICVCE